MGWIAWTGGGDTGRAHASVTPMSMLRQGALVVEGPLPSELRAETLLEVASVHPEPSLMRIQSIPGAGFSVLISQGSSVFHALVSHSFRARTASFRLTLNWDADTRQGLLSIEHPGDDALFTHQLSDCVALPGSLILGALAEARAGSTQNTLTTMAFHKGPLAIGPSATFDYHTPILTPQGYKPIGKIKAGDTITTANGDIIPVLANFSRSVPAFGSQAPVRLRAPYFGLHCDLVMAGTQRMVAEGSDVEYTFGCDSVLIPAQHLINGTAAIAQRASGLVSYFQLLLPANETLIAADIEMESLFIGRLRRRRDIFAYTTLAHMPRNLLPEHSKPGSLELRPFEAITLASMRAA